MSLVSKLEDYNKRVREVEKSKKFRELEKLIIKSSTSKNLSTSFQLVEVMNLHLARELLDSTRDIILDPEFKSQSNKTKARIIRYGLAFGLVKGYSASSRAVAPIVNTLNIRAGIIERKFVPVIDEERLKGVVGKTITEVMDEDFEQASNFFVNAGDTFIKRGSIDTQIGASELPIAGTVYKTEFMRVLTASDSCDFCKSLAGYWSSHNSLDSWHDSCRCVLETRRVPLKLRSDIRNYVVEETKPRLKNRKR